MALPNFTPLRSLAMLADKPTAIDLFAGAGGATRGLRDAGFAVRAAVENDPCARKSYAANNKSVRLYAEDITLVDPVIVLKDLGLKPGDLSLLNSCPPCQGFSTLGNRGAGDPRNDLVADVWRFITEMRPQSFVMENVPGLLNDHRFLRLQRQTRAIGYGVRSYIVDAADFGVPQRRRRLIAIGIHGTLSSQLPESLVLALPPGFDRSPRTAGDVLIPPLPRIVSQSDPLNRHRKHAPDIVRRLKAIPRGGSRADLPPELVLPCHKKLGGSSAATSVYGRIRSHEPAPTMTTRCTTPACGRFLHPTKNRGLTLREAALLQTFPVGYQFVGTYGDIERQIGNAMPVRLAEALGRVVDALLMMRAT